MMAALVALGLATAGGVFAYGSLSADDGSATPEAAVKQFVDSFGASDVAGMLEALPPSERVVLRESLESLNQQGSRLRLTRDLDLNNVSGVHLEVSGLQLTSTGLSEDVAAVNVKGTLRSTANDRELPLGDAARDVLVDSLPDHGYQGVADAVDKADQRQHHERQVASNSSRQGRRRLACERLVHARRVPQEEHGAPLPNFGHSPIKPLGADSPEAVVKALLVSSGDYNKSVALATPDESRVLYDYVPSLTSGNIMSTHYRAPISRVGKLTTHVDGDGDRRVVHIDSLRLRDDLPVRDTTTRPEGRLDWPTRSPRRNFDGECLTTSSKDSTPPRRRGRRRYRRSVVPTRRQGSHSSRMGVGDDHPADRGTSRRKVVREPDPFVGRRIGRPPRSNS